MDKDGGNKTQILHRRGSNYALSKLIGDNELEDLQRSENPDASEFSHWHKIQDRQSLHQSLF